MLTIETAPPYTNENSDVMELFLNVHLSNDNLLEFCANIAPPFDLIEPEVVAENVLS